MSNSIKDAELKKFIDNDTQTPSVRVGVNVGEALPIALTPSNTGTTTLKTDLTTTEFEITPVAGQMSIEVTNLSVGGGVHYSLNTGVDTTYALIRKDEQLVLNNYAGSIFVRTSTGTKTIQIDQRSLV